MKYNIRLLRDILPIEINLKIDSYIYTGSNCDNEYLTLINKILLTELKMNFCLLSRKYLESLGKKIVNCINIEKEEVPYGDCFIKTLNKEVTNLYKINNRDILIDYYKGITNYRNMCTQIKNEEKIYNLIFSPKVRIFNNDTKKYDKIISKFYLFQISFQK